MCKTIELRDHFAGLAMQGLNGNTEVLKALKNHEPAAAIAKLAYEMADAMMKARQPEIRVEIKVTDSRGPAYDGIGLTAVEYAQGWRNVSSPVCPVSLDDRVKVKLKNGAVAGWQSALMIDWTQVDSYLAEQKA